MSPHITRSPRILIIGAGVGGLATAVRLAQQGHAVTVLEARDRPGGLASRVEFDGWRFDAGPYILLDRHGLEWALAQLGLDSTPIDLQRIEHVYEAEVQGETVRISSSLDETATALDARWPGSGTRYRQFIAKLRSRYERLQPLQIAPLTWRRILTGGAWRDVPFLLSSLGRILAAAQLPPPVTAALGIWTHVAGQTMATAPAPLALVPAVIHTVGAYYPRHGIGAIPDLLYDAARRAGVEFRWGARVQRLRCERGIATGVALVDGETVDAAAVVSNTGLGTYRALLSDVDFARLPARTRRQLTDLPLQSPGVCAYLAVKGSTPPPYLRFRICAERDGCRLLVTPAALDPSLVRDGWSPARLIAPLAHERAERGGVAEQREFLDAALADSWWRRNFDDVKVLATRIPREWGEGFCLFQNSMNPVMTARFMRAGRLAHRSPWIRGLYLTGSATHPGQWVSFCAVSGVLAAACVQEDLAEGRT